MKVKLKDIAEIHMGYPFRSRLEYRTDGTLGVIQMKDLSSANRVDCDTVQKIDPFAFDHKYFVKRGDLIFRSRGMTNTAAILDKEPHDAIVAAPMLRIRVNIDVVLPEFLCWFINQQPSQQYLMIRREGTHGGMISRQTLENLEIDIPSIEKQKKIVELIHLHQHRQNLEKKRIELQELEMSAMLMKFIKGEKLHGKE